MNADVLSIHQIETLPVQIKEGMTAITNNLIKEDGSYENIIPQLEGMEITKETIKISYTIPLREHGCRLTLSKERDLENLIIDFEMIGFNEIDRWESFRAVLEAYHQSGLFKLNKPTTINFEGMSGSWLISNAKEAQYE